MDSRGINPRTDATGVKKPVKPPTNKKETRRKRPFKTRLSRPKKNVKKIRKGKPNKSGALEAATGVATPALVSPTRNPVENEEEEGEEEEKKTSNAFLFLSFPASKPKSRTIVAVQK